MADALGETSATLGVAFFITDVASARLNFVFLLPVFECCWKS